MKIQVLALVTVLCISCAPQEGDQDSERDDAI